MAGLISNGQLRVEYKGIRDCSLTVLKIEGVRALWKGNLVSLLRYYPNEKVNYLAKSKIKSFLPASGLSNIVSGVMGGWLSAALLYPTDTLGICLSVSPDSQR